MECSTGAGKGNGEVRRIHIVYFLSRGGRIEQPHLIRVQHLTRNGVYLRGIYIYVNYYFPVLIV